MDALANIANEMEMQAGGLSTPAGNDDNTPSLMIAAFSYEEQQGVCKSFGHVSLSFYPLCRLPSLSSYQLTFAIRWPRKATISCLV